MAEPKIPKGALPIGTSLTNPAGKQHNGAETEWMPNPDGIDTELQYRANLDETDERASGDTFVIPEFINNSTSEKVVDYCVYDKNISSEQEDEVNEAIGN